MTSYISEILIIATSILFASLAFEMGIGSLKDPGAGFWPMVICLVIIVLSCIAGIQSYRLKSWSDFDLKMMSKPIMAIASIIVYAFLLERIGYILPTPFLMLFWFRVIGSEGWRISTGLAVLLTAFFYLIFSYFLGVPFPPDIFLE